MKDKRNTWIVRGSFSRRVGCTPSPASARRVTAWSQAFGIFESRMWEMWGTWILSALPGSLPSTGCREQAHQGTLCLQHGRTDSAEWRAGLWGWHSAVSHPRGSRPGISVGNFSVSTSLGTWPSSPFVRVPPVCDVTELGVEVRCSEVTLGKTPSPMDLLTKVMGCRDGASSPECTVQ